MSIVDVEAEESGSGRGRWVGVNVECVDVDPWDPVGGESSSPSSLLW